MTEKTFSYSDLCDCHVHVIGPKAIFPLAPSPSYKPVDAPVSALRTMMDRLGIKRTVIVQPSIYGTDNSCLLDALSKLEGCARGVAVVADNLQGSELDRLDKAGIRGLRINLISSGRSSTEEAKTKLDMAAKLCVRNGWHIQIFCEPSLLLAVGQHLLDLPVPSIIDHFGMIKPSIENVQLNAVFDSLLGSGQIWVKLSAPYRISDDDPASPAVTKLAQALAQHQDTVVWASDWPHTPQHNSVPVGDMGEVPYRNLDTGTLLDAVKTWFPDTALQRRILVDNPAKFYGFSI